jgi:ABC-type lipoprotein export system ATPase subunit
VKVTIGKTSVNTVEVKDLHRQGSTVRMVTHDPRFTRHADRTFTCSTARSRTRA